MVRLTKAWMIGIALLVLGGGVGYGVEFTDVPRSKQVWYATDLYRLADLGAISGYLSVSGGVNFAPDRLMNRAEFLKLCLHVLSRGPKLTVSPAFPAPTQAPFPDVPVTAWYAGYVAFAKKWGITEAGRTRFDSDVSVTRREAVGFIMRTLVLNGGARDSRQPRAFPDSADPEVVNAYSARIVEGNRDGLFYPNRSLSRAEAVALVSRALRNLEDQPLPVRLEMTAFTLDNLPLRQIPVECPCPNFGIRLNQPNDNRNLIRISLHGDPPMGGGTYYALHRSTSRIKVWSSADRSFPAYLGENDIYKFEFGAAEDVFVESVTVGESVLSFELRRKFDDGVIARKDIDFHSLDHLVVVLGGENQDPASYDPDNAAACNEDGCGIFSVGERLYRDGYDVRMFNESGVDTRGYGLVYDVVREAIELRQVQKIVMLGYSHGGGGVWALASALDRERTNMQESFSIVLTVYVDAINNNQLSAEPEYLRPPSTDYHLNFYQNNTCFLGIGLCGFKTYSLEGQITFSIPVNDEEWGRDLGHFRIDDNIEISDEIVSTLEGLVKP